MASNSSTLNKEPGQNDEEIGTDLLREQRVLAEVLVAPRSEMIGKDLEQIRFRNFTGCIVLGLLKGRMLKDRLQKYHYYRRCSFSSRF